MFTIFTKDRTCQLCKRTKSTRDFCRKRTGNQVPHAETFGDLVTTEHKVLSEACESRNSQRHAVIVKDLATQWLQAYPCKTKAPREVSHAARIWLCSTRVLHSARVCSRRCATFNVCLRGHFCSGWVEGSLLGEQALLFFFQGYVAHWCVGVLRVRDPEEFGRHLWMTKIKATSRRDYSWREVWSNMSKRLQN